MAPTALGCVEVQKDSETRTWYSGHVVDMVKEGTLLVGFEGDVWPRTEFPLGSLRKPSKMAAADADKFAPKIGEEVELRVNATEHAPAGWSVAVVRNIKHGFYFVARVVSSAAEGSSEAIVEKDMLRPLSPDETLGSMVLQQESYKLPGGLQSWLTTPDAIGCFGHIEEQSGLVHIQAARLSLKLLGETKAIQRAKMLLEVHSKHQATIQSFQDMREKRLRALETKRNRIEGTGFKHSVEIRVDPNFVARIIGKGGETIRALQEKYDVNIRILETEQADEDRIVRIFGNSQESIEKARADVEFIEEVLPIEESMYSWILGRQGKTIQGFRDSSGLVYATLERETQSLRLCGTRHAVQDAVAMFETHIMYYPVFHQMDEEMEQIVGQLEDYGDYNARWEWGWYRDEEDPSGPQQQAGGKGGKGGKGGGKGGRDGGKGGKDGGKGGKDGRDGGKGGKGGGKDGRDGGAGRRAPAAGENKVSDNGNVGTNGHDARRNGADAEGGPVNGGGGKGRNGRRKGGGGGADDEADAGQRDAEPPNKKSGGTGAVSASHLSQEKFSSLRLSEETQRALKSGFGYELMTMVQAATSGPLLAGKDVVARARTGTGKTLAFLVPIVEVIRRQPGGAGGHISSLILSPTRELAAQIADEARLLTKFHQQLGIACFYGGTNIKGDHSLLAHKPVDILVATPGRMEDHLANTSGFKQRLQKLAFLTLDEADQLLDMGFRDAILRILKSLPPPTTRQGALFSATFPSTVDSISKLALRAQHDFIDTVNPDEEVTPDQIDQCVVLTDMEGMTGLVWSAVSHEMNRLPKDHKIMVFFTTARATQLYCELFAQAGTEVLEVHSRKSQAHRTKCAARFRDSQRGVIFSSDVSARGLDYPDVTAVIQVGIPSSRDQYIHRLGRTGRAGKSGRCILLIHDFEQFFLRSVKDLPIKNETENTAFHSADTPSDKLWDSPDPRSAGQAYQAWLGYYNSVKGLGWSKPQLVQEATRFAATIGAVDAHGRPPPILKKTVGMMGLRDVPGLNIVAHLPYGD